MDYYRNGIQNEVLKCFYFCSPTVVKNSNVRGLKVKMCVLKEAFACSFLALSFIISKLNNKTTVGWHWSNGKVSIVVGVLFWLQCVINPLK